MNVLFLQEEWVHQSTRPVKITIERNTAVDIYAENFPYIARLEIMNATKDRGRVYQVPVFVRYNGLRKSFGVDICGFRLEAAKPMQLTPQIEQLFHTLVNFSRLPTYMFVARRAKVVFPVYTIGDEVAALTIGGPLFRHVELAKVREYLTDFLHDAKILGESGPSDKLHVRGVSGFTLGLRRPVFYLKKRIPSQVDFWAPVFQSGDGQTIYTYAASDRREVPRSEDDEVLALHGLVAQVLQADRRLQDPYDLRPDRLMPAYWERLKGELTAVSPLTLHHQHRDYILPIFRRHNLWLAVEEREDEERYGLFLGRNLTDLAARVKQDFARRGLLG